ncbi:MAG: hypothetical protein JO311_01615 [Candidatus Eremiobacteraeota bacterium]|nr:hypothetical protein [Candidatus Eremiobacteraeota bacterium]MBV9264000.1 hypothetical protein [Candidatus Eremiobacteraeota bacterium]
MYRIESSQTYSRVRYAGSQRLTITHAGDAWRFDARASYVRDAPDGKGAAHAHFVQTFSPSGGFEDRLDEDPEFLTILNQPFAVRLDRSTLRDIRGLRSAVPFEATSPLGGTALLRGFLRPGTSGPIGGRPTTAVRFDAAGLMAGTLPGHEEASVAGTLRMDGVAYYSADGGLLLGLTVTMTIEARLRQRQPAAQVPVRIVYRRWMRASL